MKILFIQTGGTIDKEYAEKAGTYNFEINEPASKRVIERAKPNFEYEFLPLLKKDSLDITDEEREMIRATCEKRKEDKIIITHGTDTMVKTAEKLSTIKGKTIILVGASKPEKFIDSAAQFNIGVAVGAINVLKEGVYIAMAGRVYEWDKCYKEGTNGKFLEKI